MKILPLALHVFEFWTIRLKENLELEYPMTDFMRMFEQYDEFTDDLRIFQLLAEQVFPNDDIPNIAVKAGFEKIKSNRVNDLAGLLRQVSQHKFKLSEFDNKLRSFLDIVTDRSLRTWNQLAKKEGLSVTQAQVLQELYYRGSCNVNHLGEFLKITASASSQLVEQLVKSGFVERTEYPENRRMKQLELSPKGMEFVEEGIRQQHDWMEEVGRNLSEEEFEQVSEIFQILTNVT